MDIIGDVHRSLYKSSRGLEEVIVLGEDSLWLLFVSQLEHGKFLLIESEIGKEN